MLTLESGTKALQDAGAKLTVQRLAIIKALEGRTDHPSAERVYREIREACPTISIATVYSTVKLLAAASLARILSIDDKKVYFDPDTSPHGHFMCRRCRKIIDIPIDSASMQRYAGQLEGVSSISSSELFLYGLCTECAAD